MPLATPALIDRVDPYCAIENNSVQAARAGSDRPGTLLAEEQDAAARQRGGLHRPRAGQVVDADHREVALGGPGHELTDGRMMPDVLVTIGDHGAPPVPLALTDDVHLGGEERVGVAYHRADVEVVLPVLDRDMEVVPAACPGRRRRPRGASSGSGRRRCGGRRARAARGRTADPSGRSPTHGPTPTSADSPSDHPAATPDRTEDPLIGNHGRLRYRSARERLIRCAAAHPARIRTKTPGWRRNERRGPPRHPPPTL